MEIRPQSKHTTSPALTRNRGASPPNPAYGETSSCIPAPDGGSHRKKLLGIFARTRVLLRCLLLRPADRIEQEEEETRLATRKLPSTFAREISSCTWKTQGLLTLAMVCTRKELGLCDEQVRILATKGKTTNSNKRGDTTQSFPRRKHSAVR